MGDWETGYKRAMLDYLTLNGDIRIGNEMTEVYGWRNTSDQAKEMRVHIFACGPSVENSSAVEPSTWSMFTDTFSPNSEHEGVDAAITCNCGQLKGVLYRAEEPLGEIIRGVMVAAEQREQALNQVSRLGQEIGD